MSRRPRRRKPSDTYHWRTQVRPAILERDGHRCRIQLPGVCTVTATEVDHRIAVADGGSWYDPDNLRAACGPCNAALSARRTNAIRARKQGKAPCPSPVFDPAPPPSRDW